MFAAPTTISNYFKVFRVDQNNPIRPTSEVFLCPIDCLLALNSNLVPHTASYKFIAPASTKIPLEFEFSQFDDGKIVSIAVTQKGKLVGRAHIRSSSYADHLDSYSSPCPQYGPPRDYPRLEDLNSIGQGHKFVYMQELNYFPCECRPVETPLNPASKADRHTVWLRMRPVFHSELKPTDGLFVLLFMSDLTMLQEASEIYEKSGMKLQTISSLHHSVWIHDGNVDPLAWYLITVECRIISYGRARLEAQIYNESRKCVMTVVQEGYFLRVTEKSAKL